MTYTGTVTEEKRDQHSWLMKQWSQVNSRKPGIVSLSCVSEQQATHVSFGLTFAKLRNWLTTENTMAVCLWHKVMIN